jgi:GTP-binding protein Era
MAEYRSGFACLVGRPNAGKSTLLNALVGSSVAITSNRPQTTRHAIRGIISRPDGQLIVVDTPGLHRPRTTLGERLNDIVRSTWAEVDVIALCIAADAPIGPGDRFMVEELKTNRRPRIALITKADLVPPKVMIERLTEISELATTLGFEWAEIAPVSALSGFQVDLVRDLFLSHLPEGPRLYPDDDVTDEPELILVAELIREAALEGLDDELPHSLAVVVEEMTLRADRPEDRPLLDIYAQVFVERDSQKSIIIGKGGEGLKRIGTQARRRIEALLGTPVYLDLRVKVAKNWQRDPKQLRRLGF